MLFYTDLKFVTSDWGVKGSEYTVQDTYSYNVHTPAALGATFIVNTVRNANLILQQTADVAYFCTGNKMQQYSTTYRLQEKLWLG
jgi:hypothetical protein